MSDLDEKLLMIAEHIRNSGMASGWNYEVDEDVTDIKQAFIDAGWLPITQELANLQARTKQELTRLTMTPTPKYKIVGKDELKEVMTGQEAFECLEKAGLLGHDLEIAREALCG